MAGSGLGIFRYTESELDAPVHAEILIESARNEARVAILEILLALAFSLYFGFKGSEVRVLALFTLITVLPLLLDATIRRSAARRVLGRGPQPAKRPR